jgi:hypothetical protein
MTVTDVEESCRGQTGIFCPPPTPDFTIERVGEQVHVVISDFPLPRYEPQSADLSIIVPNGSGAGSTGQRNRRRLFKPQHFKFSRRKIHPLLRRAVHIYRKRYT